MSSEILSSRDATRPGDGNIILLDRRRRRRCRCFWIFFSLFFNSVSLLLLLLIYFYSFVFIFFFIFFGAPHTADVLRHDENHVFTLPDIFVSTNHHGFGRYCCFEITLDEKNFTNFTTRKHYFQVEDTKYDDGATPVLETALYFDEKAYKTFSEYFKRDDEQLADMILAYVNAVSTKKKKKLKRKRDQPAMG